MKDGKREGDARVNLEYAGSQTRATTGPRSYMSHIKNRWAKAEQLLELPYKKNIPEEQKPWWSQTYNTTIYGGPIFNEAAKDFNCCFHYSPEMKKFALPPLIKPTGLEHIARLRSNLEYFQQQQSSVGRIAVYDRDGDPSPCIFLSGFFISTTKFATRTHHFTKTAIAKITLMAEASELALLLCPELWMPAHLVHYNKFQDVAIFELFNTQVSNFIPVSSFFKGVMKKEDVIAFIGYNGAFREEQLTDYTTRLHLSEQPEWNLENQLKLETINALLAAERKSISPGRVVSLAAEDPDVIAISCTGSEGSSGSPLFLLQASSPFPVVAGWVYAGEMSYNFNKATRFTPELLQL